MVIFMASVAMLDTFLTMNGSKIEGLHLVLAELRCPGGSIGTYTTTNLSRNLKHGFTLKSTSDTSQFFVKCKVKNVPVYRHTFHETFGVFVAGCIFDMCSQ